jgi:raffinose/stachyose/melibiose transport system substrate-binding protein
MQSSILRRARRVVAAAVGLATLTCGATVARADDVIRWLHIEANPKFVAVWRQLADEFEKANGLKIEMQFLENQAFKAKLPTLLQSSETPSIFYTWGGGVLEAQAKTGTLRDVGPALTADGGAWAKQMSQATIDGLSYDGKVWAVPYKSGVITFFYNKALFQKANVDASTIKTWNDFLGAVKKLRAAGITPIAGGGGDKWPLHFYWGYLAMREAGHAGFLAAKAGKAGGFTAAPFVKAGERLAELGKLQPFQNGYLGASWPDTLAAFGDGRAAILLGFENTSVTQGASATDGKGLADDNIGMFPFPVVEGAPGVATDYLGRLNGWVVTAKAPVKTEAFLKFLTAPETQRRLGSQTDIIPVAKGAADTIANPLIKASARLLDGETWHQNFLDQDLGPSVGRVVNDISVEILAGQITPADAVKQLQEAYLLQ